MSVRITVKGQKKVIEDLERIFGKSRINKIVDKALQEGAKVFVKELQTQVRTFSDGTGYSKGHTYDEITISEPMTINGVRTIKVHWKGPNNRYRVIHLNEYGTIKNPSPRGKGSIARALRDVESAYHNALKQAIERAI